MATREDEGTLVEVEGKGQWGKLIIRATNLWAGTVLAALALIGFEVFGDPVKHRVLQMFAVLAAGLFTGTALMHGRLKEALKDKDYYRNELTRVTAQKAELEARGLKERRSSTSKEEKKKPKR